tara:strand:+ start:64173 stop:66368 length:2196 start_codon:yes stop_codon:yes gene_type:complete
MSEKNIPLIHLGKREYHKLVDKLLIERLIPELQKKGKSYSDYRKDIENDNYSIDDEVMHIQSGFRVGALRLSIPGTDFTLSSVYRLASGNDRDFVREKSKEISIDYLVAGFLNDHGSKVPHSIYKTKSGDFSATELVEGNLLSKNLSNPEFKDLKRCVTQVVRQIFHYHKLAVNDAAVDAALRRRNFDDFYRIERFIRRVNGKEDLATSIQEEWKNTIRKEIDSQYQGIAKKFKNKFDENPYDYFNKMEEEGLISTHRTRGGIRLLPRGSLGYFLDTEISTKVLSKKELAEIEKYKDHYQYGNKVLWRDGWRDFTAKNLETINENTNVLCLGGFGDEISTYENMGILPNNIYVIELNRARAVFINENFPEVNVYKGDVGKFLEETELEFDIVMLDYDGPMKGEGLRGCALAARTLKDNAVFGINVLAREMPEMSNAYFDMFLFEDETTLSKQGLFDFIPEDILESKLKVPHRSRAISALMLRCLLEPNTHSINRKVLNALPREEVEIINEELHSSGPSNMIEYIKTNFHYIDYLNSELQKKNLPAVLGTARAIYTSNLHIVEDHKRFVYQSAKRNNDFYSDFIALNRKPQRKRQDDVNATMSGKNLDHYRKFIYGSNTLQKIVKLHNKYSESERQEIIAKIESYGEDIINKHKNLFLSVHPPKREEVDGSKYVLPDNVKFEVVSRLYFGLSNTDIIERFPGLEKKINIIRLNYNNGKYNDLKTSIEEAITE